MKSLLLAASLLSGLVTMGAARAGTLDIVKQRGQLACGVNTGISGFSMPDSKGEWKGLDIDYCRAIAAAVLGDANKVRYTALTAQMRFTALQSGEIDVLLRNSTQTLARDTAIGLTAGPINFYDGQAFAVRKDSKVSKLEQLNGATICMAQGTTHEQNAVETFHAHDIEFHPLILSDQDTMYKTYFAGRCDVLSQDSSALAAVIATGSPNPDDYMVLPERISKEPLGPFTRQNDEQWTKIVKWVFLTMVDAEELGVTKAQAETLSKTSKNPEVLRLLGVGDDLGKPLGLDKNWSFNIISQVGNYGESFDRNVGKDSVLHLSRGYNDLWTRGGLLYAIPFR